MSEARDIVWERQPGRRWLVTIWRPGEREREASWVQQMVQAQLSNTATLGFAFGACPCCGQPRANQMPLGFFS